jgi:predicted GIY-YIG superfamily endonuclease
MRSNSSANTASRGWSGTFHSDEAITREKRIKKWERRRKLELIESFNPEWTDLYDVLNG